MYFILFGHIVDQFTELIVCLGAKVSSLFMLDGGMCGSWLPSGAALLQ